MATIQVTVLLYDNKTVVLLNVVETPSLCCSAWPGSSIATLLIVVLLTVLLLTILLSHQIVHRVLHVTFSRLADSVRGRTGFVSRRLTVLTMLSRGLSKHYTQLKDVYEDY